MTDHTIGIDISKARLDVFDSKRQEVRSFNNTEAGFRELSKWLVSYPPTRVIYEPTAGLITVISKSISGASGHL